MGMKYGFFPSCCRIVLAQNEIIVAAKPLHLVTLLTRPDHYSSIKLAGQELVAVKALCYAKDGFRRFFGSFEMNSSSYPAKSVGKCGQIRLFYGRSAQGWLRNANETS